MSTCNCGSTSAYNNCCPSAPDITQNITTIESDGLAVRQRKERGGVDWTVVAGVLTLLFTPINSDGVFVFMNGSLQRVGVDYTISAKVITFVATPPADADIEVAYTSQEES